MGFILTFLVLFVVLLVYLSPILCTLVALIVLLGCRIGRLEQWERRDAVYYAFITATTVGYGDFHPRHPRSRLLAVIVAILGLLLTGMVVAVALQSLGFAFKENYDPEVVRGIVYLLTGGR